VALVNKKPAIDWQSRVFENLLYFGLEVPSHDADAAGATMPHGRLSNESLAANADFSRRSHLLARAINI
jgi:hypothetical protein